MNRTLVTYVFLMLSFCGLAQEESNESKLKFGLNIGLYFANKNTANFYNGVSPNSINTVISQPNIQAQILDRLTYDFRLASISTDMRYNPGIIFGVNTEFKFAKNASIFTDINFINLSTSDKFTFEIDDQSSGFVDKRIEAYDINGKENRFNISVMLRNYSGENEALQIYYDLGVSLTGTNIKENRIMIENLEYSIMTPERPDLGYFPNQSQLSIGFVGGIGVSYKMSDDLAINTGLNLNYERIKLLDSDFYRKYRLNPALVLRFVKI